MRKHLSADALIRSVRTSFEQVGETRKGNPQISMEDALMSSYAMFSLKDPSMLAFERRRRTQGYNLKTVYKLKAMVSSTRFGPF